MSDFISQHIKEIVSIVIPFIAWFLNVGIKAKPKLIWSSPHAFTFLINEPVYNDQVAQNQSACTGSIKVINTGRETAKNVELIFNFKPQFVNLWPIRKYTDSTTDDNRYFMVFDTLNPKEEIGIEILSVNRDLPSLLTVRSSECMAENVYFMWIPFVEPWKVNVARFLMLIGFSASLYGIIYALQFLLAVNP
ncbi:hypothetical protein GKO28_06920 [Deefgea sp. CFH1-16]|nr:hypothetical protein [Deefgea sp. CFH1-16]